MAHIVIEKPEASEHIPYYSRYIDLVQEHDALNALSTQINGTLALLRTISSSKGDYRYAPDKWSIKEVIGHIIDTERVFAFRALWFARNEKTALPGFEQDDWVRATSLYTVSLEELITEFAHVRQATLTFFGRLDKDAWTRRGKASNAEISVRALAYIIAGHELHHVGVLKAKYMI